MTMATDNPTTTLLWIMYKHLKHHIHLMSRNVKAPMVGVVIVMVLLFCPLLIENIIVECLSRLLYKELQMVNSKARV